MKNYKVEFNGREAGAIGITYKIVVVVQAEDEKQALLKLYEKYEHISFPKFTVIGE